MTKLTIRQAQINQPWTVPYAAGVQYAADSRAIPHILGTHAVLHGMKSLGKLAAVFEALDHGTVTLVGLPYWQKAVVADMSADLLTIALRLANLYGFDLADTLERRVLEKNGVSIRQEAQERFRQEEQENE